MSAIRPQFPSGEYLVRAARVSFTRPRGGHFAGQWCLQVQFTVEGRSERASFQLPWQVDWEPFLRAFAVLTGLTFAAFDQQDLPREINARLPALAERIVGQRYRAEINARVDANGREWVNVNTLIRRVESDPMAAEVNALRELLGMDKATLRALVEDEMGVATWDALDGQGQLILRDLLIDQVHRLPPEQFAEEPDDDPQDSDDPQIALPVDPPK